MVRRRLAAAALVGLASVLGTTLAASWAGVGPQTNGPTASMGSQFAASGHAR